MVSGADNSSEQDTAAVTKELEEPAAKQMMILWRKEENWPSYFPSSLSKSTPYLRGFQ